MRHTSPPPHRESLGDFHHGGSAPAAGAIILGVEYQALGWLRQLRGNGVPCVLVDEDKWGPARFSRWRSPAFRSPPYESDEFWPWLVELQHKHGLEGWLLIATHDEQVRHIALHYDDAMQRFRFAGPSWDTYRLLYDKRLSHQWCKAHGITTPDTYLPNDHDDLPTGTLEYPLIVKPAVKVTFKRYSKAKAIQVNSARELATVMKGQLAHVPTSDLLFQEIIPGGGRHQLSYAGLFANGEPLAAFTACRLRQHPPDFGRASTYVTALHDPEVERESRRILSLLRYAGLGEVEWKRDPRDGRLKFLEVNARSWGWHSLASHVLGDLGPMLYRHVMGGDVRPVAPRYGASWVKHITDVPVVLDMWSRKELTLKEYMQTLRGQVCGCEWHKRDPMPFFAQFALVPYLAVRRSY